MVFTPPFKVQAKMLCLLLLHRLSQQLTGQEESWRAALSRLMGLGNRVAFAAKRVDTVQGNGGKPFCNLDIMQSSSPNPNLDILAGHILTHKSLSYFHITSEATLTIIL